jgi:hypothetical protein
LAVDIAGRDEDQRVFFSLTGSIGVALGMME